MDHVVMNCVLSRLWRCLVREKDLSHELLQTIARTMGLSDHQASKMQSFQQYDDSNNAIKRLAVNKNDTSNDRNRDMKYFNCGNSGHLANNKICKARSATCNSWQKVGHFASECRSKNKINSVDKKKPEGIYYINLRSSESGSESFLVDSGASVNIIDIETLEQISKVCEIDVENTNSKIYMFGSNDPLKLKGKFNN